MISKKKRRELLSAFGKRKEGYFQMDSISSFAEKQTAHAENPVINDRTWADLDMDEVYMYLDRTSSAIGQQLLYARLKGQSSFKSEEKSSQSSKPKKKRRRRKKKKTTGFEFPQFPDFNLGG